jgi:hypothetical protein
MISSTARLALASLAALLISTGVAEAQKKKSKKGKPSAGAAAACGLDFLPLVEGTVWTYEPFTPGDAPDAPGLRVKAPEALTLRVASVQQSGGQTRITVEESWRKVTVKTELTCSKEQLQVPPQSFFFAGEPGGGLGIELQNLQSTGESFLAGKRGLAGETYQELKAMAIRTPAEGSEARIAQATLEVERKMVVRGRETTESAMGDHRAIKVQVQTTGRSALESQKDKPFNMPALDSTLWFAPGVGMVRAETSAGTGWRLTGHKVPGAGE